jgi:protease PrsW
MRILFSLIASIFPMVLYLLVLWLADKNEREPFKNVFLNFLWGAVGAIILSIITSILLLKSFSSIIISSTDQKVFGTIIIAPFVEEIMKGSFLLLTVRSKNFDNLTDGLVYGGAIGLGFGMTENFLYFVSFGTTIQSWLTVVIIRTLFSAVMHSLATATFGAFLVYSKFITFPRKIFMPIAGLFCAMVIHFVWNITAVFGITIILGFLFLFFSLGIFITVFALSLKEERKIICNELIEEANNNLIPYEHLEIIKRKKQNTFGWIDEKIRNEYLKSLTKLAFRKFQLKNTKDSKKEFYLNEIVLLRNNITKLLSN